MLLIMPKSLKNTLEGVVVCITRLIIVLLLATSSLSQADSFEQLIVDAALARTTQIVRYDGSYVSIPYPNGDVPVDTGVCTDVVIRSYRALGIDLQRLVHEDMQADFDAYPSKRVWGLSTTDKNIDHRRVPNLQTFFKRNGKALPITQNKRDYQPGNLVTWMVGGNLPHIGIVTDRVSAETNNPLIVHNIGAGPKLEDMLFSYPITGHYQYAEKESD